MVEPSALERELFIVLLPTGEVLEIARGIQSELAEIYELYKPGEAPVIHITLDRISRQGVDRTWEILEELTRDSPPIKVEVDSLDCYRLNSRYLVLNVVDTGSLTVFTRELHSRLKQEGLSTIDNYQDWNFHISITNNIFTDNPIPEDKFERLCQALEGIKHQGSSYSDKVEIWRPALDSSRSLAEFKLKG
ncbi:MAG: 2'-5' RNA ligase family protein [Bacillota bacterium]